MQLLCSWCDIVCIDSFKSKLTLWPHTQWCKQRWCVPRAMVAPVTQLTECACAHLDLQGSIVLVRKCDTSWLKCKCILCRVCCSVGGLTLRNDLWSFELTLCLDCGSSGWTDTGVSTKLKQRRKRESWVVLVLDMRCLSSLCAKYGSSYDHDLNLAECQWSWQMSLPTSWMGGCEELSRLTKK